MKLHGLFLLFFLLTGDGLITTTNACNKNKAVTVVVQQVAAPPAFTELISYNHLLL